MYKYCKKYSIINMTKFLLGGKLRMDIGELWGQVLLILILIGLNAFFAASEMAIVSVRHSKIIPLIDQGNKSAAIIGRFLEEPSKLLATIQIGITFAGFLASAIGAQSISMWLGEFLKSTKIIFISEYAYVIATVIVTSIIAFITLIFGELVPKRLALEKSDKIALKVAKPINLVSKIFSPFVKLLSYSTNSLVVLFGGSNNANNSHITEEEIRMMINVGEEKGIFQETETDMINSIFEFDDTVVKEVMTPRTDIVAINVESSLEEILEVIVRDNFSRIPVFEETIDKIIGILYVKDLFGLIKKKIENETSLREIIRPGHFVSEYKKIDELFKEMQKSKSHIAIIIDEYGGTAGLITIEDLLEEIVGNIFDEYDDVVQDYEMLEENVYLVNGILNIGEINDILNTDFPEEEFDTISGLMLSLLGKMPEVGDEVSIKNIHFRIEEVDDKRIEKVRIEKIINLNKPDEIQ